MILGGQEVKLQIDTGKTCNVLPREFLPANAIIDKTQGTHTSYNKTTTPVIGTSVTTVTDPKTKQNDKVKFVIVDSNFTPLLGLRASQAMRLIDIKHENIYHVQETSTVLTQ